MLKGNLHHAPTLLQKSVFIAILGVCCLIKGASAAAPAIDEAAPAKYPAEVVADWKDQDGTNYATSIDKIKAAISKDYADKITGSGEEGYLNACHWRRVSRMKPYAAELENIMFAKHHNFGGILVGYHDNSDAGNADQDWTAKGALCVLNMKTYYSTFTELLTKTDCVVRDPCVSFDGKKVLFAMSGKSKGTGYKIYEMEIADPKTIKQLTFDPPGLTGVADFEPCYLQNGDIMFTSTRNFGLIDCAWNPSTNMFLMHGDGKGMHQVGFDQVSTFYPVLMDDGAVLYTRWEYNDRDLTNSMGLFTMNPDGTHQTEFFGNQTPWPYTQQHARPIPGSKGKVIAVAGGHHGPYAGELMMIDRNIESNGTKAFQMIAPKRDPKPVAKKSDVSMGGVNFIFQTPLPLDEDWFLVSWRKSESVSKYQLYFMDVDGNRELIAWGDQSVSQPVLIKPRAKPPLPALQANYTKTTGIFTMQDVYYGQGMKGIDKAKGEAKSLRVVELSYRAAGATTGSAMGSGPSGAFTPAITCPVSAYGASWECKKVLGEAKIYPDGSASFEVPARSPVYFQVIDADGFCIATMRSWSTLMPGETFSCVGCHESKVEAPPPGGTPQAGAPQKLDTPLGIENKPFDYKLMVQPIFDKHCISCHKSGHTSGFDLTGALVSNSSAKKSFTTSYNSLLKGIGANSSNKAINIGTIFQQPDQQPPRSFGSSKSGMTKILKEGHKETKITQQEKNIIACWIDLCAPHAGTYHSYMAKSDSTSYQAKLDKRATWEKIEVENLKEFTVAIAPESYENAKAIQTVTENLSMGYLPSQRAIVLRKSSQGVLFLMDLQGRVISTIRLSNKKVAGATTISLPSTLGSGLYLAKFEGVDGTQQVKFTITQ